MNELGDAMKVIALFLWILLLLIFASLLVSVEGRIGTLQFPKGLHSEDLA
ncbi:MAG: hypothetical protein HYW48_09240 [Deltaproteobacteria bacterium]|nr:hypothetical protein [Deltaproteobacteria bacterium]